MRENGPLLSRVVDPPGTKGGPRAGNFPGPPQKHLLSRVEPRPGTKGPFVPGRGFTRDKRPPPNISPFFLRLPPTLSVLDLHPLPPPSPAPTASCSPPSSSSSAAYLRRKRTRRSSSAAPPRGVVPERRHPRSSSSPRAPSSAIAGPRPRALCPPRARHRPPPPHPDAARRHVVVLLPDLCLRPGCLARDLGRRLCASGSPRRHLCALSLYVRRAPSWPYWQPGRAQPAGAPP